MRGVVNKKFKLNKFSLFSKSTNKNNIKFQLNKAKFIKKKRLLVN
jgi:hypothetical protein